MYLPAVTFVQGNGHIKEQQKEKTDILYSVHLPVDTNIGYWDKVFNRLKSKKKMQSNSTEAGIELNQYFSDRAATKS